MPSSPKDETEASLQEWLRKINRPVSIGGYVVESGEPINCESDNVALVSRGEIDAVIPDLEGTAEKENGLEVWIAAGQTCMTLVDEALVLL